LVKSGKAGWKLEYWIGKKKAGELNLT